MHDVELPFSTDRDSARLAINAAQESPSGPITALGGFPYTAYQGVLSPLGTTMISVPPQDHSAPPAELFSCPAGLFSESEPPTLAGRVGTLWPRIHAVLFAWCRREWCWNLVTRSPAFREYLVRRRGQSVDRWALWRASANHQPCAC